MNLYDIFEARERYVYRIDSSHIPDFEQDMKTYYHNKDFTVSGREDFKGSVGKVQGVYASDKLFTALYATGTSMGNGNRTRYVAVYGPDQPTVWFDRKDVPRLRGNQAWLTVFDARTFRKLPSGEYFSKNPGKPVSQQQITDPFRYIRQSGWEIKTANLEHKLKELQLYKKKQEQQGVPKDKQISYGAEGMGFGEGASGVIASKAQAKDPRYSMSLTKDVRPGQIQKNLKAFDLAEDAQPNLKEVGNSFIKHCMKDLGIKKLPKISLVKTIGSSEHPTFGTFDPESNTIRVAYADRHIMDVLRTLGHELTHHKQREENRIQPGDGETGSDIENEANARAGVLMRDFADQHGDLFNNSINEDIQVGFQRDINAPIKVSPHLLDKMHERDISESLVKEMIGRIGEMSSEFHLLPQDQSEFWIYENTLEISIGCRMLSSGTL